MILIATPVPWRTPGRSTVPLEETLGAADIVSIHLPVTKETTGHGE